MISLALMKQPLLVQQLLLQLMLSMTQDLTMILIAIVKKMLIQLQQLQD